MLDTSLYGFSLFTDPYWIHLRTIYLYSSNSLYKKYEEIDVYERGHRES